MSKERHNKNDKTTITEFKEEIKLLKERIVIQSIQLKEKDKQLEEYWNHIQQTRISVRLKRIASGKNIANKLKQIYSLFKKILLKPVHHYHNSRQKTLIPKFVRNSFDHSISNHNPLVSIIILNRNGLNHLQTLFDNWEENTVYDHYEIIVFDNNSSDRSITYLNGLSLTIKIITNDKNDSFSLANNKAARHATGDLLLFLNNDTQPLYGWLNQMIKTYFSVESPGLVGAKLIYPYKRKDDRSLKLQHSGTAFTKHEGYIKPYNLDNKVGVLEFHHNGDILRPAVTAACALISKEIFDVVGGFDENYVYGYEDVDLGLTLHKKGYTNWVSNGAFMFHNEFGTQASDQKDQLQERRRDNLIYFQSKWGNILKEWIWHELMEAKKSFFIEKVLTIGFVVTESGIDASAGDYFTAEELAYQFKKMGWKVNYYSQAGGDWYDIDDDVDILFVMLHGYNLEKIRSGNLSLLKIAWARNWFESFTLAPWFSKFDIVFASSLKACEYIRDKTGAIAHPLPIASNVEAFQNDQEGESRFQCDYCFTGSYWNAPREIIEKLDPSQLPEFKFNLYGKNWEGIKKFKKYHKGFVPYCLLPKVYASTKLLIDDANGVTKEWGSVNSRVFDAIASGVLVISNGIFGSEEVFNGKLPTYRTSDELHALIRHYLDNEDERVRKINELQCMVSQRHTYAHRANTIKQTLKQHINMNFKT